MEKRRAAELMRPSFVFRILKERIGRYLFFGQAFRNRVPQGDHVGEIVILGESF